MPPTVTRQPAQCQRVALEKERTLMRTDEHEATIDAAVGITLTVLSGLPAPIFPLAGELQAGRRAESVGRERGARLTTNVCAAPPRWKAPWRKPTGKTIPLAPD